METASHEAERPTTIEDLYEYELGLRRQAHRKGWGNSEEDLDDLIQDTYFKAFKSLRKPQMIDHPFSWLLRIMERLWIDRGRWERGSPEELEGYHREVLKPRAATNDLHAHMAILELREAVQKEFAGAEVQMRVMLLIVEHEWDPERIAEGLVQWEEEQKLLSGKTITELSAEVRQDRITKKMNYIRKRLLPVLKDTIAKRLGADNAQSLNLHTDLTITLRPIDQSSSFLNTILKALQSPVLQEYRTTLQQFKQDVYTVRKYDYSGIDIDLELFLTESREAARNCELLIRLAKQLGSFHGQHGRQCLFAAYLAGLWVLGYLATSLLTYSILTKRSSLEVKSNTLHALMEKASVEMWNCLTTILTDLYGEDNLVVPMLHRLQSEIYSLDRIALNLSLSQCQRFQKEPKLHKANASLNLPIHPSPVMETTTRDLQELEMVLDVPRPSVLVRFTCPYPEDEEIEGDC